MAVPDFQSLMVPVLQVLSSGEQLTRIQLREAVCDAINLSAEDREARYPSRPAARLIGGRIGWAVTYMAQAGLVDRPRRGVVEITDRGRRVLADNPHRVDVKVLSAFPEFQEFRSRRGTRSKPSSSPATRKVSEGGEGLLTPLERIEEAMEEATAVLESEILDKVVGQDPIFLERLVLRLLVAMGYGGTEQSAEHLGRSNDEGVDGVIRQDALGLERIYVQAKRYSSHPIGRPSIQAFVGALQGAQADRGVFITTSRFTPDAIQYADKVPARVILIDGSRLASLMVHYNIGVQTEDVFTLKKVDDDFFDES